MASKAKRARADTLDLAEGVRKDDHPTDDSWVDSAFASRYLSTPLPKNSIPDKSMPAAVAYQIIEDMRNLDTNPRLNLASFVTTWMEPEAIKLITNSLNVNFVDMEEYPTSTEIHDRCVAMLGNLYHTPGEAVGTATTGSSEAIMLAGLAMKRRWQARRKAEGKPTDKPNLIMGYNVQVCWEKFTRYFEVEEKFVPLEEGCYVMTPEKMEKLIDENTIGVCGILGSTYNGEFEDIAGMDKVVEQVNKKNGWNVGIHVDGASGGFVAPFTQPDLLWDFRLKNVVSINVSGHKYGLVYPGVGWVLFRNKECLPEELVFHVNYLGSDQATFTLNFSKGATHILAQYYQLIRLGRDGYTKIMHNLLAVSRRLAKGIEKTGHFTILSNFNSLPLVAFSLKAKVEDGKETDDDRTYDEFDVADRLRMRGWVLPAYSMAPNAQHVKLLRAVVREDMSMGMADELIRDLDQAIEWLDHHFIYTEEQMKKLKSKFVPHRSQEDNPTRTTKMDGPC